ncbi:autotransporter outer membrane beta-barrel domain-containing protein [Sinorhizobium sp. RAC02]|uniref:autotransporter outer membrane beta-barrel domain-containing protein n=1 Tax=Sinorhizobium sp. RAC02 TaxID=1842534 RepID=UPI0008560A40|nr:autotransporter outer membrane beta-barrel domain-containing protein [Sinorhizobium sp. RAC02]AOF92493.1 outer membrane autotransporter barrel domain protein [Sinorhizobium sp. RAC02]
MAGTAHPVLAQTAWTGASGNDDWFDAGNWDTLAVPDASTSIEVNPGNAIISGNDAEGDTVTIRSGGTVTVTGTGSTLTTTETRTDGGAFNIENGGLVTNSSGIIDGIATVSGGDGSGNASTWINNSYFVVGEGATGALNILSGGRVLVNTDASLGQLFHGDALVSGNGSSWENTGRLTIDNGSLRIEDGGRVSNTLAIIGDLSAADVVVTGGTSTWVNSGQLTVGSYGTGIMRVEDGATVTSSQGYVGAGAGSVGTVTVTGSNSNWEVTDFNLVLGNFGVGSVTIEDGARVFAKRGVHLGISATDASGTLSVNGTPGGRGILETSGFRGGMGTADLTIDGGIVRAIDDNASFFSNYGSQQVNLGAGGGIIDTNGHDIGIAPVIAGVGSLTKDGLGTLSLTGENTYGGGTTIFEGTLQLGDGGTTGSILGDVTNNGILAFNRADLVTFDGVISGSGAVEKAGSGTAILTTDNSYTGGTTITAGTLQLGDGDTTGGILGDVANDGVLAFNRSDDVIFSGLISGNGGIEQAGTGKTTLTADNTFAGNTTIADGTLQLGNGGTTGSVAGNVTNDGTLVFDRSNTLVFDGVISGSGTMVKNGAGVLELTANNSYLGATAVNTGTLLVNGDQSAATGLTTVNSGATLGGSGTLGGDVTIADGAILAPGSSPGTLTINGDLSLADGATLDYQFGEAGVIGGALNDLVNVGGDLILDGTLNVSVSSGGTFGSGIYRVFNYDGTLTDNGLELGTMPFGSDTILQTAVNHQVNLINTAGLDLSFWDGDAGLKNDGTINGGDGVWHVGGADDNWTEATGTINAPYENGSFAVFAGASGTVTVDNGDGAVNVAGMQFASDGYAITGDALTLVGPQVTVRVGDGTATGSGYTATIDTELSGTSQLVKTDLGTLVLRGTNTYTGGTAINGGTVQIASDANLGAAAGGLSFDGGTLNTTADITSGRSVDLTGAGTFLTDAGTTATLTGSVSGVGSLTKDGTGNLVITGNATQTGGTTITAGMLQLGDGGTTGSILGSVTNNGILAFNRADVVTFDGTISGTGGVHQIGSGKTILTADNTFEGNTKIVTGTLQLGDGGTTGSVAGDVANDGTLVFDRSNTVVFDGVISGSGIMVKNGAGVLELTANNSYGGATAVNTGTLLVNGDQSAATGLTTVNSGATLGGSGTLGGDVTIADGAILAPGSSPGTLTINGDLSLADGATLDYQFGEAGVVGGALNDLVNVGGDLILDGTLNVSVSSGGTFGSGIYRVFNYDGTLTDNGLELGTMPFGSETLLQTSVDHQVNLINTAGLDLNFWDGDAGPKNDGTISGGDGVWHLGGADNNWTEATGAINAPYQNGSFAVFAGTSGTVTVDNSAGAVTVAGMQFASDGYAITGDALTLVGPQVTVRVGDGTATGSGYTATIDTELSGTSQLVKTDLGTLVLRGTNTYTGGTAINGGTVQIASDANLGAAAGGLSFDGGTLNTTADITSGRSVDLTGAGTFLTDAGTTATLTGSVSGVGSLTKDGTGNLVITGNATQTGGTTITAGTLQVGNGATSGSLEGNVTNNSILAFNRSDDITFNGTIIGSGSLTKLGSGTTTLSGGSSYSGGTTIDDGTLELGNGGTTGSILGDVTNNGILAFNRADVVTFDGVISGAGSVHQIGSGKTILTADNTYTRGTTIADGTLELGDGGTTGSLLGDVTNNGILAFNRTDVVTFDGVVTGTGGIDQTGMGTTILTGDNSALTGSSQVQKGILSVNDVLGGSMAVRGGRLQGMGQVGETTNFSGGTIAPGDLIGMLTVAGDYVGSGGTLEIETVLGDDNSATDKLIVTGDTSGNTNLKVINLAGVGAQTVEGIKIIDVAGVSDGSFTLLGNYVFEGDQAVIAGAYAYRLYQGGESTPTDGDWYLRSVLNSETPLYQPLTPIYEVYANVLQSFNELDTLQQRLGNRSWSSGAAVANSAVDADSAGSGMWGRILGRQASIDPRKSTTGANYDVDIWQLQGGADGELYSGDAGDLVVGFSARYGTISADVSSTIGDGSITSTGFGLDGSMTWYGTSGLYLDAQANATWYDSNLSSSAVATGRISGNDGFGYAFGLEAGQQIALGTNWSVTPQAQLTYSRIDYNDFTDPFGGAVSLKDAHKLRGRLGISADYENSWADRNGQTRRLHAYGVANLYYDLQSNSDVRVSGVKFMTEQEALWGGLGLGGTYSWGNDKYAIYGEATVDTNLNNFGHNHTLTGRMGLNVKF